MRRNLRKPIVGGNEMFMWVLVYQLYVIRQLLKKKKESEKKIKVAYRKRISVLMNFSSENIEIFMREIASTLGKQVFLSIFFTFQVIFDNITHVF